MNKDNLVNKIDDTQRFGFGKNWYEFIQKNFEQEKVDISRKHMLEFLKLESLEGKTFLDIGCGSGLHSIAALESGAISVHGFDYDPNSVKAAKYVQEQVGSPKNWTVEQGDVLNDAFVETLPKADIVYSWGVLHHTGEVWHAIKNAASRVKPGGLFYIALYSADVQIEHTPEFWLNIKRKYVASGSLKRHFMDWWYVWNFIMNKNIFQFSTFLKRAQEYKKNRGMSIFTDIRDWMGGWPMEFVYDADAIKFCEDMGFKLINMATGEANSEFLFQNEEN